MIYGYHISEKIRDLLHADADVNAALGTLQDAQKVFIGSQPPVRPSLPLLMVPDHSWVAGEAQGIVIGDFEQPIHIWTKLQDDGHEDLEQVYDIATAIDAVLVSLGYTSSRLRFSGLRLQSYSATVIVTEGDVRGCFKTLIYQGVVTER